MSDVEKRFRNPSAPMPVKRMPCPSSTRNSVRPARQLRNVAARPPPMAINGVRKSQRNSVIPTGITFPFKMGTHSGSGRPRWCNVEANAKQTNTDTIPFQNKQNSSNANAWPMDRCVEPMTTAFPSRRYHVPAGGRFTSTFSSTAVPKVRVESLWERLHFRQNAMSLATLTSSLGMTSLHRGHVGVTARAEASFSSNLVMLSEHHILCRAITQELHKQAGGCPPVLNYWVMSTV